MKKKAKIVILVILSVLLLAEVGFLVVNQMNVSQTENLPTEAPTAAPTEAIEEAERKRREDEERKRLEAWLQQQQQNGNAGNTGAGGTAGDPNYVAGLTWLVPISYTEFSSPFGYRINPIYADWRFHYGVDFGAPSGEPIYATRSGVVTTATYGSSGGWYVIINHQDGYTSNYLHMTHYIVSPGQYVAAGEVIGYCGSTGDSTGPHLHFAIYYNGTAVNPADYIAI